MLRRDDAHPCLPVAGLPWSHIALGFVTSLLLIHRKVDHLPKLPNPLETANLAGEHIFHVHGIPAD